MNSASFNLTDFVRTLDLTAGACHLVRIEEKEPNVIVAFVDSNMSAAVRARLGNPETEVPVWVRWVEEHYILRFSVNLNLGDDSRDEKHLALLLLSVNALNCLASDRITKIIIHGGGDEGWIGTVLFTLFIPPPCFESHEALLALNFIVSANLARFFREAIATSHDLHNAMHQGDALSSEEVLPRTMLN